jgi:lipoate---protein ligase
VTFLDRTLATAAENLALDEALLLAAEAEHGGEVLRVWEPPTFAVVLGSGCKIAEDVKEAACARDGIPVLRRSSGGGTVLLGPGCLLFSLVLSTDAAPELGSIPSSYAFILGRIIRALADVVPGLEMQGISDLAVRGLKCSGNAQQRKRQYLLHHGTLLYGFPLERIGDYLHLPQRQPDYRRQREHAAFLGNLPLERVELVRRLRDGWGADRVRDEWPAEMVRQLVSEKYGLDNWTRRR